MDAVAVKCVKISRSFGGRRILEDVDLEVGRGRIVGLLGPNGAGKTTLIRIISTQIRPDSGAVFMMDKELRREREVLRCLGLVPQEPALYGELTLRENLMLMARAHGVPKSKAGYLCSESLEGMGLGSHADRKAAECSTGMRQALNILMGIMHDPSVLLLDEPTVGLDPSVRLLFWSRLERMAAEGRAVLVATHALDEARRYCHEVAFLHRGRVIAQGPPGTVASELAAVQDLEEAFLEIGGEGR